MAYKSLNDALEVARENMPARKELASKGPGYVMVAEVLNVDGEYELRAVTVHAEHEWQTSGNRYIVRRVEGLTCPVCEKTGSATGAWTVPGMANGPIVTGLDPDTCAGCHDTLTHQGIAPTEFRRDGTNVPIARPT